MKSLVNLAFFATLVAITTATTMHATPAELVTPGSVTLNASSQFFPVGRLTDNSGLSGAADIDNYTTITHAAFNANTAWVTNGSGADYYSAPVGPTPVMTFALTGTFEITDLVLWGYHSGTPNNNEAKNFTVGVSSDGVNFTNVANVTHARTAQNQETLSLGGPVTGSHVRLTITDNHFGTAGALGGDRVGLGEVKFVGAGLTDLSTGKSYSYTELPNFVGGTFYFDDPHVQTPGVFDTGDLSDGVLFSGTPTVPPVSTLVGWDPASQNTEIVFDLEGPTVVENIRIGTHTFAAFANGAPDGVDILFSNDGITFGSLISETFSAPPGNGHHDFFVEVDNVAARFVKFVFDGGAVLTGNTPNKWMLDEITIHGQFVPEPTTVTLMLLGGVALMRRKRVAA